MGNKKHQMAIKYKEAKKAMTFAILKNSPIPARKMRLVADQLRGEDIKKALAILKFSPKEAARRLEKLLLSAIANWQAKNESDDVEKANLFIKEINGILYYLDNEGNVYKHEDVLHNKYNPTVILKIKTI